MCFLTSGLVLLGSLFMSACQESSGEVPLGNQDQGQSSVTLTEEEVASTTPVLNPPLSEKEAATIRRYVALLRPANESWPGEGLVAESFLSDFGGRASPELMRALLLKDAGVRCAALRVLERIGAHTAVPLAVKLTVDSNPRVRRQAGLFVVVFAKHVSRAQAAALRAHPSDEVKTWGEMVALLQGSVDANMKLIAEAVKNDIDSIDILLQLADRAEGELRGQLAEKAVFFVRSTSETSQIKGLRLVRVLPSLAQIPHVVACLDSENSGVQAAAAYVLDQLLPTELLRETPRCPPENVFVAFQQLTKDESDLLKSKRAAVAQWFETVKDKMALDITKRRFEIVQERK